jgi:hypothetical protein
MQFGQFQRHWTKELPLFSATRVAKLAYPIKQGAHIDADQSVLAHVI